MRITQNQRSTPAMSVSASSRELLQSQRLQGFGGQEGAKKRASAKAVRKSLAMITGVQDHYHVVSKQCPADGVWRIGMGVSPDRVRKARLTPSESSAGHGLPPQRPPKQCPANGVQRIL